MKIYIQVSFQRYKKRELMFKDAIEILAIITGIFAIVTWLLVFIYFILVGIDPMFIRIAITAIILIVVSIYCMKREAYNEYKGD